MDLEGELRRVLDLSDARVPMYLRDGVIEVDDPDSVSPEDAAAQLQGMQEPYVPTGPASPGEPTKMDKVLKALPETWPGQLIGDAIGAVKTIGDAVWGKEPIRVLNPETGEFEISDRIIKAATDGVGMAQLGGAPIAMAQRAMGGADDALRSGFGMAHPGRISTRLPTGRRSAEDPVTGNLQIGLDAMRSDPRLFEANVGLIRDYPNLPAAVASGTAEEVSQNFIQHVKENLLYLYDNVQPEIRERSKLWYDGARAITDKWSAKYNVPDTSIAGVLAALSPQKDWFMNVSLAERVLDIYTTKQQHRFDAPMTETMGRIFGDEKYAGLRALVEGKTLAEMATPETKAMWLRIYDQAYNDRGHRLVTPEGNFGDFVKTASGENSGTGWGSLGEIGKAIESIEANGDKARLTTLMGERHKVRSFYNNILDPKGPDGDVTIDTHAVAAGLLRPLSGNSLEVAHNFANYPGAGLPTAKGSAVTGVQGLYGIYAEAYRQAAAERGILPREMQSITWEAVRGLFPDTFKNARNSRLIDGIWQEYRNGKISLDEARGRVVAAAGGIDPPSWARPGSAFDGAGADTSYAGELPRGGVPGGNPAAVDGGARGGTAGAAAGLDAVPPAVTPAAPPARSRRTAPNRGE